MVRILKPLYEILYTVFSLFSRTLNAVVFGGSMNQTLSARAFVESQLRETSDGWDRIYLFINALFFWQEDHCHGAWLAEVMRATKTLRLNERLSTLD